MTLPSDPPIGDLLLSVDRPAVAHYPPGTTYGPRLLDDFEFLWMLQGFAEWQCDDTRHVLAPGSLLLARPGMRDRFAWDPRRPSRLGYVRFRLRDRSAGAQWPVLRTTGRDDPLRGLTRYLLWLGSRQPARWEERIHDAVALMLTVYVQGPLPSAAALPELPAALDPILDHVRVAWSAGPLRPLSRTELARAGSMSPGHLSRIFREHCGVGAVAAFELLRLMRAETLLRRSNMSVSSIAQACGFADPYHFSHRFKNAYGVSPRTFREGGNATRPTPEDAPGVRLLAHRIWGTSGPIHNLQH